MLRLSFAIAVGSMLCVLATGASAQSTPPNFPVAVICYAQADQSWRVGYLHRISKNGDATYLTLDRRLNATLDAKGVVVAPNRRVASDCVGKTLNELRSSGRLMEIQPPR